MADYFDTSALIKLVVEEAESSALEQWLAGRAVPRVSSDLARTELIRAVRRACPDRLGRVRAVLAGLTLLQLTPRLCDAAGRVDPPTVRSRDALHLAAALDLGDDLDVIVTYDDRMSVAARAQGLEVLAPPHPLASSDG